MIILQQQKEQFFFFFCKAVDVSALANFQKKILLALKFFPHLLNVAANT